MALQRPLAALWSSMLGLIFTLASSQDQYPAIVPPDGNVPILSFVGKGVQIYQCSHSQANESSYVFQGAEAELFASGDKLNKAQYKRRWGYHYFLPHPDGEGGKPTFSLLASPSDNDSSIPTSTSTFKIISNVTAASPKNIPSLLLRATSHSGNGPLSMMSYAQRINTVGGVAPAGQCKMQGEILRVPYRAQYRFWSQAEMPAISTPASVLVPPGHSFLACFFGLGSQIYRYNGSNWVLSNVSATLSSLPGTPAMGRHYFLEGHNTADGQPQPTWEFFSPRGRVSAKLVQKVQKTPTSIPWLLAQTTSYVGAQSFASRVAYVQRLSTVGGIAPCGIAMEVLSRDAMCRRSTEPHVS
eukprot:c20256_g1_i2 orf=304-1371(-)